MSGLFNNRRYDAMIRQTPYLSTDFLVGTSASAIDPFVGTAVLVGTINSPSTGIITANHPGCIKITSTTTANSGYYLGTNTAQLLLGGGEQFDVIFNLSSLANNTVRLGFHDTASSADATDGVYIEIDGSGVATGKTATNSTRSSTGTTTTLSATTWYRASVVVTSTSLATFTVYAEDGTTIWSDTLTTNIPSASGRECGAGITATNSTTSATEILHIDFMGVGFNRTLVR